jgi:hypothetical protein
VNLRRLIVWALVFGGGILLASQAGHFFFFMDNPPGPARSQAPTTPFLSKSEFKKWVAQTDATVFDLDYRGMEREDLNQAQFIGPFPSLSDLPPEQIAKLVQSNPDLRDNLLDASPFIQSVGLTPEKSKPFNRFHIYGLPEGVIEYEGRKVLALYVDLNRDGKLGRGEKLEPVQEPTQQDGAGYFITPDFTAAGLSGEKCPYRMAAQIVFDHDRPQVMLAPFCSWEGTANLGGRETSVRLVDNKEDDLLDVSFLNFGLNKIQTGKEPNPDPENPSRSEYALSHLVRLDGAYYQLRVQKPGSNGKTVRIALSKDPSPLGRIEIQLDQAGSARRFQDVLLTSQESPYAVLHLSDSITEVPQGRYYLREGRLPLSGKDWVRVTFSCPPWYDVVADQTVTVKCGKPEFKIEAIRQGVSPMPLPVEETEKAADEPPTFPCGTEVRLNLRLSGAQGEEYGAMTEYLENGTSSLPERKSHLQVLGPDGQEVASADPAYG